MTAAYKEYAEALFMLAREQGNEESYASELKTLKAVFELNPEYKDFLDCPSIPNTERTQAIRDAFEGKLSEDVLAFLCILCERSRIGELFECIKEYERLLDGVRNTKAAIVRSSSPIGEKERARLKDKLEKVYKCSVTLEFILDASLIGGAVIEIDGKILDGSVRTRLEQVKGVIGR